jgi:hypothetical protein
MTPMMKRFALALCLASCSHEQTVQEGWQLICDAPERCCSAAVPKVERATMTAAWIVAHVTNREAREDFDALGTIDGDKRPLITERLRELGLSPKRCAILR